jgi:hypothetical protein
MASVSLLTEAQLEHLLLLDIKLLGTTTKGSRA